MSTTLLVSTSNAVGAVTLSSVETFALDTVIQCKCVNPIGGVQTPAVAQLLLSNDGGNNYVLADTKKFTIGSSDTSYLMFTLSAYMTQIINTLDTFVGPTAAARTIPGALPPAQPTWTHFLLRFKGNTGGTVTVSAIGDSGPLSGPGSAGITSLTGDATAAGTGAVPINVTKTGGVAFAASATVDTTNAANISSGTVAVARLPQMIGSGTSHAAGIAPDPGASANTTHFLREDATWAVPPGSTSTPGGTSGQLQVNSAGSFGGVTVTGDLAINSSGVGTVTKTAGVSFAPSATVDTTNAANILSGTVAIARLPAFIGAGASHSAGLVPDPGATPDAVSYLRRDGSWAIPPTGSGTVGSGTANQLAAYASPGTTVAGISVSTLSIASTQVTGLATSATTDTTNATNITGGTLPAAQLPNPSASTLGGVQSKAAVSHNFITSISTAGVPVLAQPAFTDISGTAAAAQLPVVGLTITQHTGTLITSTQSGGTITFNWALGDSQTSTMTANATIAFGSPAVGQSVLLSIVQAASGGPYTISGWPSGITWVAATGPPVASVNASNALLVKIYCVSSGVYYGWNLGITGEAPNPGTITEVSQTSSFTAASGQFYAISGSSAVTATLPTAVGIAGQTIRIRCAPGYTGLCTITPNGSETIGGASSRIIFAGESPLLQSDGANWVRTGGTIIPASCTINPAGTQSITHTTLTTIAFDTNVYDNTGQMAVVASHEIQIFRPGRYMISASVYLDSLSAQEYQMLADIAQNGTASGLTDRILFPIATGSLATNVSMIPHGALTCATGDLITVTIIQNNTANSAATVYQGPYTYLSVTEIPQW